MKKPITLITAIVTAAAMTTCAFAGQGRQEGGESGTGSVDIVDNKWDDNSHRIDIGVRRDSSKNQAVYSVEIKWGDMKFKYTPAVKWNPTTHKYDPDPNKTPIFTPETDINTPDGSRYVCIYNRSNRKVSAALHYDPQKTEADGYNINIETVTYSISSDDMISTDVHSQHDNTLASADNEVYIGTTNCDRLAFCIKPTGTMTAPEDSANADYEVIGQLTLKLTDAS